MMIGKMRQLQLESNILFNEDTLTSEHASDTGRLTE